MEDPTVKAQQPDFNEVADAWEKWEDWLEQSYRSLNQLLLERAQMVAGQKVLDLGCGAGYPALLSAQIVGPAGNVFALDVAEKMLAVARRRAKTLGLTNVDFQNKDVTSLPFVDKSFHAITARFSLMFVPMVESTLRESYRVLKEGGMFASCVWAGPEKNLLPRKVLEEYYTLPKPDVAQTGPYRFSRQGDLSRLLQEAGFSKAREEEIPIKEIFISGQQFVQHILEASALWGALLRKLSSQQLAEATKKLVEAAEEFRSGNEVHIPRTALLVTGVKDRR